MPLLLLLSLTFLSQGLEHPSVVGLGFTRSRQRLVWGPLTGWNHLFSRPASLPAKELGEPGGRGAVGRGGCFPHCVYKALNFQSLIPFLKKEFSTSHQNSSYNTARSREPEALQRSRRKEADFAWFEGTYFASLSHYFIHMFIFYSRTFRSAV